MTNSYFCEMFSKESDSMDRQEIDLNWPKEARRIAHGIRQRVLGLTIERNGCYLSQALSSAEILAVLYSKVLTLGPSEAPEVPPVFAGVPGQDVEKVTGADYNGARTAHYDRLLISPAHYAVAVYAALVEVGRMAPEGLLQFNTDGSTVEMIGAEHSPGFELTTGSFGQALSQAGGIAMARKLRDEPGMVYVFMSDGELEEGQTWEALQALTFYELDNVIVYIDVNGQQVDGLTKDVMNIEPIDARIQGFGARAIKVDGHDIEDLASVPDVHKMDGKPTVALCYTNPSQGIPLLDERKPKLHYVRFKSDEEKARFEAYLNEMKAMEI